MNVRNHGIDEFYIRNRITQLRAQKGVSENKMSIELGHNRTYIQNIMACRTMPSITGFLTICDYLDVTPKQFFDSDDKTPVLVNKNIKRIRVLNEKAQQALATMLDIIEESQRKPDAEGKTLITMQ